MRKLKITKCLNATITRRTDEKYKQEVFEIDCNGNDLITCWSSYLENGILEAEANAQLIADAFNTANKCDMLPSELLELLINVYCSINQYGNISDSQKEILEKLYYNE